MIPYQKQLKEFLFWEILRVISMGVCRNVSRVGAMSTFYLSFFRLQMMQCKWTYTKRFILSTPQRKFLMKARVPFVFVWNPSQVELYSSLRRGYTVCRPLQVLLNWGLTWTIHFVFGVTLVCPGWCALLKIWSEIFSTFYLSEMLFLFINLSMSIFWVLSENKSLFQNNQQPEHQQRWKNTKVRNSQNSFKQWEVNM